MRRCEECRWLNHPINVCRQFLHNIIILPRLLHLQHTTTKRTIYHEWDTTAFDLWNESVADCVHYLRNGIARKRSLVTDIHDRPTWGMMGHRSISGSGSIPHPIGNDQWRCKIIYCLIAITHIPQQPASQQKKSSHSSLALIWCGMTTIQLMMAMMIA